MVMSTLACGAKELGTEKAEVCWFWLMEQRMKATGTMTRRVDTDATLSLAKAIGTKDNSWQVSFAMRES